MEIKKKAFDFTEDEQFKDNFLNAFKRQFEYLDIDFDSLSIDYHKSDLKFRDYKENTKPYAWIIECLIVFKSDAELYNKLVPLLTPKHFEIDMYCGPSVFLHRYILVDWIILDEVANETIS